MKFASGTLWNKTLERSEQALKSGALRPISTISMQINDAGVEFLVRVISSLERKEGEKRRAQGNKDISVRKANPFLPYEEEMFVADISDSHVCLLNKYYVIKNHLLMVTREFEAQETLLTHRDFEAMWRCMAEFDALAFYNGGKTAGASQPHKHLQMIPLPINIKGPRVPIETLFSDAKCELEPVGVPRLPFVHSFVRFAPGLFTDYNDAAQGTFRLYRRMLQEVGLNRADTPEESTQAGPYNMLCTREWMLIVPRSKECFHTILINALAFAGAILVQDEQQMELLRTRGGMAVLQYTAIGR